MKEFNSVELVLEICKSRKIPISKLEKACGFSNGYVKSILYKGSFPTDRLIKIADYLNLSVNYLATGEKEEEIINPFDSKEQEMIKYFQDLSEKQKDIILSTMEQFSTRQKAINIPEHKELYGEPEKTIYDKYYNLLYPFSENDGQIYLMISGKKYEDCMSAIQEIDKIPVGVNRKIDYLKQKREDIISNLNLFLLRDDSDNDYDKDELFYWTSNGYETLRKSNLDNNELELIKYFEEIERKTYLEHHVLTNEEYKLFQSKVDYVNQFSTGNYKVADYIKSHYSSIIKKILSQTTQNKKDSFVNLIPNMDNNNDSDIDFEYIDECNNVQSIIERNKHSLSSYKKHLFSYLKSIHDKIIDGTIIFTEEEYEYFKNAIAELEGRKADGDETLNALWKLYNNIIISVKHIEVKEQKDLK